MHLSVVICTHNPRTDFLQRTLRALEKQSLDRKYWELIVVDSGSSSPVVDNFSLAWHIRGTHLREERPGLTSARVRGISAARGNLIVFVDDDNVLAEDYLERATEIHDSYPFLGAFGSGQIKPEFEVSPSVWMEPYLERLAIRNLPKIRWSNDVDDWYSIPIGAGICVHRNVAEIFTKLVSADKDIADLGRKGSSLAGGEDIALALCGTQRGLGWGVFPSLQMTHLIPEKRLTERYMTQLLRESSETQVIGNHFLGRSLPLRSRGIKRHLRHLWFLVFKGRIPTRLWLAEQRGIDMGYAKMEALNSKPKKECKSDV